MTAWISSIGAGFLGFVEQTGLIVCFCGEVLSRTYRPPFRFRLFLEQFLFVANASMFIVCLTGIFTGMLFAVQIYFGFRMIDPAPLVGPSVAIGFVRELGPVFTAIVVTGR